MLLEEFNYNLPENLIAQLPAEKRDMSKMMVLDKVHKNIIHKHFSDIIDFLTEDDLLVLNNTKVIPARLYAKKDTGALIEIFLVKEIEKNTWICLIKPSKRVKPGMVLMVSEELSVEIIEKMKDTLLKNEEIKLMLQQLLEILKNHGEENSKLCLFLCSIFCS